VKDVLKKVSLSYTRNNMTQAIIKIKAELGEKLRETITKGVNIALESGNDVEVSHNDKTYIIEPKEILKLIVRE
jgi:hypothetical protein